MVKEIKAPEKLVNPDGHGCCPGCGHGIINRLIFEVLDEMGQFNNACMINDVACGCLIPFSTPINDIGGAHGRVIPTTCGFKRVRPDMLVFGYAGDGATYSIGMQHCVHAAMRNENITMIVANNTVFGMTGGQMSPETLLGQKTTSSPAGRTVERNGNPVNVVDLYHNMDIAYLARGAVDSVAHINQTKKYIRKAFEKQLAGEGYTYVEVLSMCPTNWNLSPVDSQKRIAEEVSKKYTLGEFIERSAK